MIGSGEWVARLINNAMFMHKQVRQKHGGLINSHEGGKITSPYRS
jgi:hypothetical protein